MAIEQSTSPVFSKDREYLGEVITRDRTNDTISMTWELYRDKVLTSHQASEILVAIGCTVIYDSHGKLIGYY